MAPKAPQITPAKSAPDVNKDDEIEAAPEVTPKMTSKEKYKSLGNLQMEDALPASPL
jgi:hypothetical protein